MKMRNKFLVLGLVSALSIGCLVGFAETQAKYPSIVEDGMEYTPIFELVEITLHNDIHDRIVVPYTTSSYGVENSEGTLFILEDNDGEVTLEESEEWNEWATLQEVAIVEMSSAPRNIASYVRPENGKTVVEIAGYYTNENGEQVEYYDTKTFDFLLLDGYDFFPHHAPDVINIPSTAATWFSETPSPYQVGLEID